MAVARALAMEPEVILKGEPLSNLDALLRLEMRSELKGVLAGSKTTAIYVTHDQVEAMSLADRISVMKGGYIVHSADPVQVYRNPAARFVAGFIGNPPMNFLSVERLGPGRCRVAGVEMDGPQTDRDIEFAIRPEDMVAIDGTGTKLDATIRVVEPLGAHTLVTCNVAGCPFRAILESDTRVAPGDRINLAPMPDRVRCFDKQTSLAVQ